MTTNRLDNYNTLQDWFYSEIFEYAPDIYEHGCGGGINGLIYDSELALIYTKFESAIWSILYDSVSAQGYDIIEYLNLLKKSKEIVDEYSFKRVFVWLVVEFLVYDIYNDCFTAKIENTDNADIELIDLDLISN